jgi:tRNA-splicing ligase RtcB
MRIEELGRISDYEWEIPLEGDMLVPGRIFADAYLLRGIDAQAKEQIINVAGLPGIMKASLAMPDAHWGYGFPIGGVAAMDPEQDGVVSMGGVGFDVGCGVKTLRTGLTLKEVKPKLKELLRFLFTSVPAGLGIRGKILLSKLEMETILETGAKWVVEQGYGSEDDLDRIEDGGCAIGAKPAFVSQKARRRVRGEIGTLGSGNHYLELQYVDQIYDTEKAQEFGLELEDVLISIHCGSRALGHQIGTDYLRILDQASRKYELKIRERQLVSAPINSDEGQAYLGAEMCALNYSYANRQVGRSLVT